MTASNDLPETRLSLSVEAEALDGFCLLTGGGFKIRIWTSESVKEVLCGQLAIEPSYVENRIQTIFLDSTVVDDPNTAIVAAGSTIALSAAMPGVAGAMLRRGSHYSPMRSTISHDSQSEESTQRSEADMTLQLFNMLQQELGPAFLKRGIRLSGRAFADLLRRRGDILRSAVLTAEIDSVAVDYSEVLDVNWKKRQIDLRVVAAEP